MTSRVLILGANGRFGRAASDAFVAAGWRVVEVARNGTARADRSRLVFDAGDASVLSAAASGMDVIVNALNPPYPLWQDEVPRMTASVIAAARANGCTVMIPGNVYNYASRMPEMIRADTPQEPDTRKGRIRVEMEAAYHMAGIRTIVLRAGDFIEGRDSGNWFETHMTNRLHKGVFTYPGNPDIPHAWAWLPDMARATVALCEMRATLPDVADIPYPGITLTGREMRDHLEAIHGGTLRLKRAPWTLLRAIALGSPLMREVLEMRYLWDTPHQIAPEAFRAVLPDVPITPAREVLRLATQTRATRKPHRSVAQPLMP